MGGSGSGRLKSRDRELVENCASLDIAFIACYGLTLFPVYAAIETDGGRDFLLIDYNASVIGRRLDAVEQFDLTLTKPYFGGHR